MDSHRHPLLFTLHDNGLYTSRQFGVLLMFREIHITLSNTKILIYSRCDLNQYLSSKSFDVTNTNVKPSSGHKNKNTVGAHSTRISMQM